MDWASTIGFVETHTEGHILGIRLALAALFGAMIGFEREGSGPAGLRTHILIAVAACLFTLITLEIHYAVVAAGQAQNTDPIRAVEAVTAGIAFLGAGAIFQQRGSVHGLTTGAGMWLAGAVGASAALGYYLIALGVAVFAVLVMAALRRFAHQTVRGAQALTGAPEADEKAEKAR